MEVTRHNFSAALPLVRQALADCQFFAIDCEMTGLFLEGGNGGGGSGKSPPFLNDIEDRYEEMLASSDGFSITQFGLSAFVWEDATRGYRARTFNFYLFPRPFEGYDVRFVSQAASLDFLASCGFDFNRWIRDGVSYMPVSLRDAKLAALDRAARERPPILPTKPADIEFVETLVQQVTVWLADEGREAGLVLQSSNSYQRALQYQELRKDQFGAAEAPGFYVERVQDDDGRPALRLNGATAAEIAVWEAEQRQKRSGDIHAAAGFAAVLEAIQDCGKPAIGHNLSFDLSYSLRSFAGPLPPTWEQYKQYLQLWLPSGIYDTKYLASRFPDLLTDTALGQLYDALLRGGAADSVAAFLATSAAADGTFGAAASMLPAVRHAEGFERYEGAATEGYAHEAGFDAFMTGAVFACLVRLNEAAAVGAPAEAMAVEKATLDGESALVGPPMLPAGGAAAGSLSADACPQLSAVQALCWRMNLSRSDIEYAALKGEDPIPDRSHVLFVTGLVPGAFRHGGEITRKLADGGLGQVRGSLIEGGTAALVEFADRGAAARGAALLAERIDGCVVEQYEQYKSLKAARRAAALEEADGAQRAQRGPAVKRARVEEGAAPTAPTMPATAAAAVAEESGASSGRLCSIM